MVQQADSGYICEFCKVIYDDLRIAADCEEGHVPSCRDEYGKKYP